MVTKVMEAAPPTRKYEIMSGNTKAALKASASMPTPKSQAMYFIRTKPMMCEKNAEAISTRVAVKTVCACEGRSKPHPRVHLLRAGTGGWVEGCSATTVDSTGVAGKDDKRRYSKSISANSSVGLPAGCTGGFLAARYGLCGSEDWRYKSCNSRIISISGAILILSGI